MADPTWDEMIVNLPNSHFLQTSEWAEIKNEVGWQSKQMTWENKDGQIIAAGCLLIRKQRLFGFGPEISIGYLPRGPLLDWSDVALRKKVLEEIECFARQARLIFIKIDPEIIIGRGIPGSDDAEENTLGLACTWEFGDRHWKYSPEQIQFKNTAVLELTGMEEDWLKRMKQKARYNLRLAQRSGVTIRIATDIELPNLYQMYAHTAARDGFIIREKTYYLEVWKKFIQAGMATPLIAEVDGEAVAGLILFHFGKRAWYFYGMSTNLHREKMPNYLLQWEAMRTAKSLGCEHYDLWGAPDLFTSSDGMYGVFRFKEGLGAEVIRTAGAWDYPIKPLLYFLYQQILPRLLTVTRLLRRKRIQQEVN